jgi:hypothetical protein
LFVFFFYRPTDRPTDRHRLQREQNRRTMELELATQAREESERRWAARWETLPAHHEARLEVERQRLSEDQARAAQRAAALAAAEEAMTEEGKRLREALREETETERRRVADEVSQSVNQSESHSRERVENPNPTMH